MEVGLASRHEEAASEKAAYVVGLLQLLTQLGGYNSTAGARQGAAFVGRTPTHDRLRHRLARTGPKQ